MENITKSIIYGNAYKNNYGTFLPICSSISDRSMITNILDYLKESPHFRKYNRIAYAYRVEQIPVVFITEKKNVEATYYEDYFSDETIEGSGQKLMHLLEKFNIRNVVLGVLIEQYNPLMSFQTTNFRAIVQNSRLLLEQLYRKVINLQQQTQTKNINDLLLQNNRTLKMKKCDIIEAVDIPKQNPPLPKERPNHIYTSSKPAFLSNKPSTDPNSHEINFLWERCKVMKDQYEHIMNTITSKQLDQLKYFVMYDKNPILNGVIQMFITFQGINRDYLLTEYDFNNLKTIPLENVQQSKLRAMEDILKINRKLNVDSVMGINRAMGILFSLLQLTIKFSKCLHRITDLLSRSQSKKQEQDKLLKKGNGKRGLNQPLE